MGEMLGWVLIMRDAGRLVVPHRPLVQGKHSSPSAVWPSRVFVQVSQILFQACSKAHLFAIPCLSLPVMLVTDTLQKSPVNSIVLSSLLLGLFVTQQ